MYDDFVGWILIALVTILLVSVPLGINSADFEVQIVDEAYPEFQSDGEVRPSVNNAHYLLLGAVLIVIVIFGAVLLRRPKS